MLGNISKGIHIYENIFVTLWINSLSTPAQSLNRSFLKRRRTSQESRWGSLFLLWRFAEMENIKLWEWRQLVPVELGSSKRRFDLLCENETKVSEKCAISAAREITNFKGFFVPALIYLLSPFVGVAFDTPNLPEFHISRCIQQLRCVQICSFIEKFCLHFGLDFSQRPGQESV